MRSRRWPVPALVMALMLSMLAAPAAGQEQQYPSPPDACPDGAPSAGFEDVSEGNVHFSAINCAVELGIAKGKSATVYDPAGSATRAQIATLLAQSLEAAGIELPADADLPFEDVSGTHADNIAKLAAVGVISGRTETEFAPNAMVSRQQVASLIQGSYEFALGLPEPAQDGPHFDDVSGVHADNIDAAFELGLMVGRGDGAFQPNASIRRDQIASVVTRLFASIGEMPEADFELTVLHINDGESWLLSDPDGGFPGAARFVNDLQAMQQAAQAQGHSVVTISAGDNYLAGPRLDASLETEGVFYDAIVYNEADFDAMTIGNHEFDFGPELLAEFIEAVDDDIPFLSANLDFSGEAELQALVDEGRIAASHVVERDGTDVGIIGATYEELASISSPRNVVAGPVLEAVQAEVDALQADGVDHILLSSHLQDLSTELSLVPQLSGVDAVIGGGGGEDLRDKYPLFAVDADGRQVPVVTVPGEYTDVGQLELGFDTDGDLVRIGLGSALVNVPVEGEVNTTIQEQVVDPVAAYVADLEQNVIATTEVTLDGRRDAGRSRETNLGNLLADSLLESARDRAADYGVEEADIALQNGGGMRADTVYEPGDITELNTFDIAAFTNIVAVEEIDGEALAEALEHSVSDVPDPTGHHGQWAGVDFRFDTSAAVGERITEATVTTSEGTEVDVIVDGDLVAPNETFTLASIDFLLTPSDGYDMFDGEFTRLGITYQQALADRMAALGTITADDYPDLSIEFDRYQRFGPIDGTFIE